MAALRPNAQGRSAPGAVVIGLGWTGSILSEALTAAGLDVVAIERGPWRNTATDFPPSYVPDELRYRQRHELFLQPAQSTPGQVVSKPRKGHYDITE